MVNIPSGVKPGQRIRLAGQGGQGSGGAAAGDLYAELRMVVPPHLSAEERRLFEELAKVSAYEPRAEMTGGGV